MSSTVGNVSRTLAGEPVFGKKRGVDYLSDFEAYELRELDRAPDTVKAYLKSLAIGSRWIGKEIWKVDSTDLRRLKREAEEFTPSTRSHIICAYKAFHRWGALEGYWQLNGIAAIPLPRVTHSERPPVSTETARVLLGAAETPNEVRLVYLGLYAGCRISESANMRDHHWRGDRLTFVGKGRKERTVPVHPELAKVKDRILSESPKSGEVLQAVIAKLRERTGALDLSGHPCRSHALRKRFATSVYDDGNTPREVVAQLLGHSREVTDLYAKVSFGQMRGAVQTLTYWAGEPTQLRLFE